MLGNKKIITMIDIYYFSGVIMTPWLLRLRINVRNDCYLFSRVLYVYVHRYKYMCIEKNFHIIWRKNLTYSDTFDICAYYEYKTTDDLLH